MILAVLQARMSSTRLPGKVMKPVLGAPMIGRQLERLGRCRTLDRIVVATSHHPSDDPLAAYVEGLGLRVFRGSLPDVLGRFRGASVAYGAVDHVVRLTADCPLVEPSVVDDCVRLHLESGADYTSNTQVRTYPVGLDVEVVTNAGLAEAAKEARDAYEREHVTPFFYRNPDRYRIAQLTQARDLSELRWTVDTPEDFEFVSQVYYRLYPSNPRFGQEDVLGLPIERRRAA
jgi:spore coat polysaccharide biosynthesis protein SpsF